MRESILHRMLAMVLSFWIFVVSVGVFVDFHYCHGKLVDVGVFEKAQTCYELVGMERPAPIEDSGSVNLDKKSCCSGNQISGKLDCKSLQVEPQLLKDNLLVDAPRPFVPRNINVDSADQQGFQSHAPPLPSRTLYIEYEVFRL